MKKLLLIFSTLLVSLSLTSCNTTNNMVNDTTRFSTSTIGTGMGAVAHTGSAIGQGMGSVLDTSTGWIMGKPTYSNNKHYKLKHGKYVAVHHY